MEVLFAACGFTVNVYDYLAILVFNEGVKNCCSLKLFSMKYFII